MDKKAWPQPFNVTLFQTKEPVITRILPHQPRTITRNVPATMPTSRGALNVKRTVQTVRCVSPDSTTDIPTDKPCVFNRLSN